MSKNVLPYYKASPRDFFEGTIGMSFETKCCYRVLLDLIYMQSGILKDDAHYICGQLGCSKRKWAALRIELICLRKIQVENGFITNFRATLELESTAKVQDKNAENGSKSHKNRNLNERSLNQPEPEPEPDIDKDTKVPLSNAREPIGDFESFWELYPNRQGRPVALVAYEKAVLGVAMTKNRKRQPSSHDSIMDGLKRYIRDKPPDRNWLNPATFLNQERYRDEPAGPSANGNNSKSGPSHQNGSSLDSEFERRFSEGGAAGMAYMAEGATVVDLPRSGLSRYG